MSLTGSAAIAQHHHDYFVGHALVERRFDSGPMLERLPAFRVHEVSPGPRNPLWSYAGIGLWEATEEHGHGIEFVMTTARASARPVELISMISHYHARGADHRFDVGHTVPIGEPWMPGSICDHLLVSLPYPFGAELELCEWDGGHARLLWLLPITAAEKAFRHERGLEALEARFESAGMIPTDVARASVV